MIIGEFRKLLRNKVFIVMVIAIAVMNILNIFYRNNSKDEEYILYKNLEQKEYVVEYYNFINEINERADVLLESHINDSSVFYKRDIEKTKRDYNHLGIVDICEYYNIGFDEYTGYSNGIFFIILFSYLCMEYIFFYEKKNGLINILRTTKKGRKEIILSKWFVFMCMILFFTIVQELITIFCFGGIYEWRELYIPIQNLLTFRDCTLKINMFEGLLLIVFNRIILSIAIASIIFLLGISMSRMCNSIIISIVLYSVQYVFYSNISINSSLDKLCCINFFYVWNAQKFMGVYHNVNLLGYPVEKNMVMFIVNIIIILATIVIAPIIFCKRYQDEKSYEHKFLKIVRNTISKCLHFNSLLINEFYKLFILQRKWFLFLGFIIVIAKSINSYVPQRFYQTSYEATYHMYLSKIEGRIDDLTEAFIEDERSYIATLEKQLNDALEEGDDIRYIQFQAEYVGRKEAFNRLLNQYDKVKNIKTKVYLIDELDYKQLLYKYDRDVILFLISGIVLIIMFSGIYASEKENKIIFLSNSTKKGRKNLKVAKVVTAVLLLNCIFICTQLPMIKGYVSVIKKECLNQKLEYLFDPSINSSMTLMGFLAIILIVRYLLYCFIGLVTFVIAQKTKSEFMTSVFVSIAVLTVCITFYFLKTNITMLLISLIGG